LDRLEPNLKPNPRSPVLPKGIPGRRFPFRVDEPGDHETLRPQIEEVLKGVRPMVVSRILRIKHDADQDLIHDISQGCLSYLWRYALAKFDLERKPAEGSQAAKLSTFLSKCVSQYCRCKMAETLSKKPHEFSDLSPRTIDPRDHAEDSRIELLAAAIQEKPENYLTPTQSRVFRAVMDRGDNESMRALSARLGYASTNVLSDVLARIRHQLSEVANGNKQQRTMDRGAKPNRSTSDDVPRPAAPAPLCDGGIETTDVPPSVRASRQQRDRRSRRDPKVG